MLLLDRFGSLIVRVRSGLLADPEPDAERLLAPLLIVAAPDDLAGTDQGGGPLELLDGQEPQRVPHQHGDPLLTGPAGHRTLEPSQGHRVGRQAQIRFGLAAARGEPQQVGDRLGRVGAILVVEPGDSRQVQEQEGQLERIPRPVGGHVDGPFVHRLVPPPLEREDRVDALLPHGEVGEPERLGGVLVLGEQGEPRLDAAEGLPAPPQGRLAGRLVQGHVGLLEVGQPLLDPRRVSRQQGPQLRWQLRRGRLTEFLHVHNQTGHPGPVGAGGGRGAGHLVGGDHHGREPVGLVADALGTVGVEAHPMADAELDLMAVEHRHLLLLGEGHQVGLAGGLLARMALEDRPVVGGLDDQFGLEQPGAVPQLLRLGLTVDEEQRHAPEVLPFADQSLHLNRGKFGVRGPVDLAGLQRDRLGDGLPLRPLPDDLLFAAQGCQMFAPVPVVVAPSGGDLEVLGVQRNAEGHPERRREHRLGGRGRALDGAVLDRTTAALGQFVELLRR